MPKVIGCDEVNYSPSIAGDCLVAACYLKAEAPPGLLKDSKQTTERERLEAFAWLQRNSLYVIESASVNHLPELGIYKARNQAMWRAITGLIGVLGKGDYSVIVDGLEAWRKSFFEHNPFSELATYGLDNIRAEVKFIKDADEHVPAVSAASIIAKVYMDALFHGFGRYYPDYGVALDRGGLSGKHLAALRSVGPCPWHRTDGYGEDWWKRVQNRELRRDEVVRYQGLSRREMEVAKLIADGCLNKEIASALNISEQTVKNHVGSIMQKLEAKNRAHVATKLKLIGGL